VTGADGRSPEGGTRSTSATLVVLTPQQALLLIANQIKAFQSSGVLNGGETNSLLVKLNMAISNLNTADNKVACNQLTSFVNEVNAYVATGILASTQANQLLAGPLGVNAIMAAIPC
jgi:hypothetical protein